MGILMETTEAKVGTAGYRRRRVQPELFGAMAAPGEFYADTLHTIAINTRETEFGSIVEPIPITLKAYKQFQAHGHSINGYGFPQQQMITSLVAAPRLPEVERPSTSSFRPSPVKDEVKDAQKITRPPKKKWIKEYLEEEPKSPVSVRVVTGLPVTPRSNGVVRPTSPVPVAPPCLPAPAPPVVALEPVLTATVPPPAPLLDFAQEHSRPRTTSISHGPPPIPSPPSVSSNGSGSGCSNGSGSGGSSGSAPRAGTREVHNKLEKNRRAHLKECFELLKRQLPATPDDKKTSNLSILGSAIRYIQVLRRKERDCEHEMERLAREKIAAQQRLSALKREISVRTTVRPRSIDSADDKSMDETINGPVLGIPLSISASPPRSVSRMETSPPRTLNLSTKLRTLPIQITPTTSQVVRTSYGTRPNTLTLTTLAPADTSTQNGQTTVENGVTNALSTLVHPAQIHLPISQVVGSSGLVVSPAALQLLSTSSGLRVLQGPVHTNGVTTTTVESRISTLTKENGLVSPTPVSTTTDGSVVVNGLTPLVVSQPAAHLLQTHTLTHKDKTCKDSRSQRAARRPYARPELPPHPTQRASTPRHLDNSYINFLEMVETQMVKGSVAPLTVSAQYLSATTIVKPVVVVSAPGPAPSS
ncbi:max-binding protein MNT-like isoform X1 [Trichoplusia ni]|uniref:Max-binding protein MNT n=1 Tax=Trichoplusia ni TaxID=7111 RepID=A0A7E5WIS5_TRINI|nr:max-binding protein MNT-like isoform X1 [Trichoplusia ni]XP_026740619.1 max-binding protein MNT-like isoform X1 [Trichoplusia ni]